MTGEAMSPTRALTIALSAVIEEDEYALFEPIARDRVSRAGLALHLAKRVMDSLPAGWVLTIKRAIDDLDEAR